MRDFTKLTPTIFDDKRFLSLVTEPISPQVVFFYLMGGKHQNSAGCYKLPDLYAASDLHCSVDGYVAARRALVEAGLILYDEETNELYIVGWFASNGSLTNWKHAAGTERLIYQIESQTIADAAYQDFETIKDAFERREEGRKDQRSRSPANVHPLTSTPLMQRAASRS
jgi:hypothetical protein